MIDQTLEAAGVESTAGGHDALAGTTDGHYQAGDVVEYYSATNNGWIRATVLAVEPAGTYKLNVRPGVPADKIRRVPGLLRPPGSSDGARGPVSSNAALSFSAGDTVEYFSASSGRWIVATVLGKTAHGTYDLDVKKDAAPERVRAPPSSGAANSSSQAGISGQRGQVPATVPEDAELTAGVGAAVGAGASQGVGGETPAFGKRPPPQQVARRGPNSMGSSVFEPAPRTSLGPSRGMLGMGGVPRGIDPISISLDAPLQLVRVEKRGKKWFYEVCPEAARVLQSQGGRQIAICSICGLYRTGKSYILNLLLERVQRNLPLFQVGNTTQACTEGLWLWGSVSSSDDDGPLLAFIDCEGFGSTDSDRTRDAQLMTLCSLLSSVLVLNTRGALNEGLFNALALTCRFAEHVEERGNEASRPVLLWLLRDFQLDLLDPNGNPISPSEYLEQALHAAPLVGHDQERGQAAREVRQSLLRFFSQRQCVTLVRPAVEEGDLQRLPTLPYGALREDFRAGVEALRRQLVATCNAYPKTVGAQPLGCAAFVSLMQQLVAGLNENQILSVKGAWETVQHAACGDLVDELRAQACSFLRTLSAGKQVPTGQQLPLADEAFRELLQNHRDSIAAEWNDRAVGEEVVRRDYWQDLSDAMTLEEETARQQNARIADEKIAELCRAWMSWLESDAEGHESARLLEALVSFMARSPSAAACRGAETALDAAGQKVARDRMALARAKAQLEEAFRQASETGEAAQRQQGAVRLELEQKQAEVNRLQEELRATANSAQSLQMELQAKLAELQQSRAQQEALAADLDASRARDQEARGHMASVNQKLADMQSELEQSKLAIAKAEADRVALTSQFEQHRGALAAEVDAQLKKARAEFDAERKRMEAELQAAKAEKDALLSKVPEQQRLSQELSIRSSELEDLKAKLQAAHTELESTRNQQRALIDREGQLRADLDFVKAAAAKSDAKFIASERALRKAKWETDTMAEERRLLLQELQKYKSERADIEVRRHAGGAPAPFPGGR